jgi:hypothetical protein
MNPGLGAIHAGAKVTQLGAIDIGAKLPCHLADHQAGGDVAATLAPSPLAPSSTPPGAMDRGAELLEFLKSEILL